MYNPRNSGDSQTAYTFWSSITIKIEYDFNEVHLWLNMVMGKPHQLKCRNSVLELEPPSCPTSSDLLLIEKAVKII